MPSRSAALLALSVLLLAAPSFAGEEAGVAVVLRVSGVIGPALGDYVRRGIREAGEQEAALVILQMDTPGGLDTSMRGIIQDIIASPVPVVSFVYPGGARAASAGTYILYASHVAAMAPATNLGAATPVQIAGLPGGDRGGERGKDDGRAAPDAMERKVVNDAVAYIRGLAQMRGRNADWAERAVREGVSLSAREALREGVIDLVADDLPALLDALDGREVELMGARRTLSTKGLALRPLEPDWRARLLAVIADPNVAYVLMLVGIYGLIYEFASPGMVLPGVAGTICLLLALFAFQVLPISLAGLALIVLGIAFMIGELFVPSFGALGIGGLIAFVIGSVMLLDSGVPGYGISLPVILLFAALSAGFFIVVLGLVLRSRRRPVVSGREQMIGATGVALDDFQGAGRVRVHSEDWNARSESAVRRGGRVRVLAMEGLLLVVEPAGNEDKEV
jgi:membrane-bound serine protease (ClpP class)